MTGLLLIEATCRSLAEFCELGATLDYTDHSAALEIHQLVTV